ncbi:MAG: aspartate carbamoyltransferase regulatory subunit [Bacteroidales bacterium]
MTNDKQLLVSAIENGIVIDHIPCKVLFKVVSILKLDKIESNMTLGVNLDSSMMGKKSIIKVSNLFLEQKDLDKIALIAPSAKVNIIKEFKVSEKKQVALPKKLTGIVKCINPKCICNHENIMTSMEVLPESNTTLRCTYCEKIINKENIVIL